GVPYIVGRTARLSLVGRTITIGGKGRVVTEPVEVAGLSIRGPQLQQAEHRQLIHELLFIDIPGSAHGIKITPLMPRGEHRRTIPADTSRKDIPVLVVEDGLAEIGIRGIRLR